MSSNVPFPSSNPLASRALSAFEFCFGAFIVIEHNVFHIVPNEVIVLSVLGLISIRLRDGSWFAMGFKRPASWRRILLIAPCRCDLARSAWAIPNRTCDLILRAEADPTGTGKRDYREPEGCICCFVARVDVCRFRRRNCLPRISTDACSRYWKAVRSGLLDRDSACFDLVWVRALLQRHVLCDRFRRCRNNPGICLHVCRSQSVAQHFGSRIH